MIKNDIIFIIMNNMSQHTSIDLKQYTDDNINVVEVYFSKKQQTPNVVDVTVTDEAVSLIESRFKNGKEESFKAYYMKDKAYVYELANDNQIVTSKYKVNAKYVSRNRPYDLFVLSSKIEKYPPYMFPCTNEIDHVSTYTIKEFKINNRITLNIRAEDNIKTIYIEYRHSPNVEIDKMNEIVNRLAKNL